MNRRVMTVPLFLPFFFFSSPFSFSTPGIGQSAYRDERVRHLRRELEQQNHNETRRTADADRADGARLGDRPDLERDQAALGARSI